MRRVWPLLGAALVFLAVCLLVDRHHVLAWERHLTIWLNDAPAWVAHALWPLMQLGSLLGPVVVGVAAAYFYGRRRGAAVFASGLLAWVLARYVKDVVARGRPLQFIPHIHVRDGNGTGLGFVSGHTAVAFAIVTALVPVLPRWGRVLGYVLATLVGVARVVHGVHFPLDVVGGACLGIACGCIVELVLVRLPRRHEDAQPVGC